MTREVSGGRGVCVCVRTHSEIAVNKVARVGEGKRIDELNKPVLYRLFRQRPLRAVEDRQHIACDSGVNTLRSLLSAHRLLRAP